MNRIAIYFALWTMACIVAGIVAGFLWALFHRNGHKPGWLSAPVAFVGTALFVLWNRRRTAASYRRTFSPRWRTLWLLS